MFVCRGFWKFYISKKLRSLYLYLGVLCLFLLLLEWEQKISIFIFAGVVGLHMVSGFFVSRKRIA